MRTIKDNERAFCQLDKREGRISYSWTRKPFDSLFENSKKRGRVPSAGSAAAYSDAAAAGMDLPSSSNFMKKLYSRRASMDSTRQHHSAFFSATVSAASSRPQTAQPASYITEPQLEPEKRKRPHSHNGYKRSHGMQNRHSMLFYMNQIGERSMQYMYADISTRVTALQQAAASRASSFAMRKARFQSLDYRSSPLFDSNTGHFRRHQASHSSPMLRSYAGDPTAYQLPMPMTTPPQVDILRSSLNQGNLDHEAYEPSMVTPRSESAPGVIFSRDGTPIRSPSYILRSPYQHTRYFSELVDAAADPLPVPAPRPQPSSSPKRYNSANRKRASMEYKHAHSASWTSAYFIIQYHNAKMQKREKPQEPRIDQNHERARNLLEQILNPSTVTYDYRASYDVPKLSNYEPDDKRRRVYSSNPNMLLRSSSTTRIAVQVPALDIHHIG